MTDKKTPRGDALKRVREFVKAAVGAHRPVLFVYGDAELRLEDLIELLEAAKDGER